MLRTQVYLLEEMHRDLMLLAKSTGVNFSSLIREGVEEVLIKRKKSAVHKGMAFKNLLGAGSKNGPKNLAKNIDHYLYGQKK